MISQAKLRELRTQKGLTLKRTAELIGVPTSTYRSWEYGTKIPANMISKLSEVLNINIEILMGIKMPSSELAEIISQLEKCIEKLKKL